MISTASTPGLYFTVVPRPSEASPLRTDVAGFIGRTRRGIVGSPIRVAGWREYLRSFGGLLADSSTTYAVRGYFENGGEIAYVVRLSKDAAAATALWKVGDLDANGKWPKNSPATFPFSEYLIEASSPGRWGNDIFVNLRYRRRGPANTPEVDIKVRAQGEQPEYFTGIPVESLQDAIQSHSILIRIKPDYEKKAEKTSDSGQSHLTWEFKLNNGSEGSPLETPDYLNAVAKLGGEILEPDRTESLSEPSLEVALLAVPGLYEDLSDKGKCREVLQEMFDQAERLHDRLVIVDLPPERSADPVDDSLDWFEEVARGGDSVTLRTAAVYHPGLRVSDPLGGVLKPLRCVPPSGHVAGLISRLDRERGPHHTPANATVLDAVDITQAHDPRKQARLQDAGINLIRCFPGRGLVVWGGRTMSADRQNTFIAHRRLIHKLVRAIRRVADPLVFDNNGPELWLTIVAR